MGNGVFQCPGSCVMECREMNVGLRVFTENYGGSNSANWSRDTPKLTRIYALLSRIGDKLTPTR